MDSGRTEAQGITDTPDCKRGDVDRVSVHTCDGTQAKSLSPGIPLSLRKGNTETATVGRDLGLKKQEEVT